MKAVHFVVLTVCFISCKNLSSSKEVKSLLAGTYTNYGKDDISEAFDTLAISAYNEEANTYKIVRSTGFNRFIDGKKMPKEDKIQEMMAVFDEKKMALEDSKTGRLFFFTPGKKELIFGSARYAKMK